MSFSSKATASLLACLAIFGAISTNTFSYTPPAVTAFATSVDDRAGKSRADDETPPEAAEEEPSIYDTPALKAAQAQAEIAEAKAEAERQAAAEAQARAEAEAEAKAQAEAEEAARRAEAAKSDASNAPAAEEAERAMSPRTLEIGGDVISYYVNIWGHVPDTGGMLWQGSDSTTDGSYGYFIGHNPGSFHEVANLAIGDVVRVCDGNGNVRSYSVAKIFSVPRDGTWEEHAEPYVSGYGESVSFQTCVGAGVPMRVVVCTAV